jgi:hypothetical protein
MNVTTIFKSTSREELCSVASQEWIITFGTDISVVKTERYVS